MLKLYSWNVNGIRAVIRKGFQDFLSSKKPDIICLQEIKINDAARAQENFDFKAYEEFWNSADKPGYAGTATFVKNKLAKDVIKHTTGVGEKKFDTEGRVQTLEFKKFYLVNCYFPHTRHDLSRLKFKQEFNAAVRKHAAKLNKKKPVILTGDLNVAHEAIDLKNPKTNMKNPGFTAEERCDMTKMLETGFIDTFRNLHPDKIQYSWWAYRFNARARNVGWRIDYFLVADKLKSKIKSASIHDQVLGSDHCPVELVISDL